MILWAFFALALGTTIAFPNDRTLSDPDILLDSLNVDDLEKVLSEKMTALEVEIFKTYEMHLKDHEDNLQDLHHRHRRNIKVPSMPTLGPTSWHSYVFDTYHYREKVVVRDYGIDNTTMNYIKKIVDVYPVRLENVNAIYKDKSDVGFILENGDMTSLMVRNKWTRSLTGCECSQGAGDKICACCEEGGVVCPSSSKSSSCIAADASFDDCITSKAKLLTFDSAVAFEYHAHGWNYPTGLRQIVIVAKGNTVQFYRLDDHGLQEMPSAKGHHTIKVKSTIKNLGYGEVHAEEYGTISKKRYLFIFGEEANSDVYYEILVNSVDDTIETSSTLKWEASGSLMKVWQANGKVTIAVQNGTDLYINELTSDQWGRQKILLKQVLELPKTMTSWQNYATGFNNFIVAVTPSYARIYSHRRGKYSSLQDLTPSGLITQFEGVVPVNIPSCKGDILIAGQGQHFQTFVWDIMDGGYMMANETTLSENVLIWSRAFGDVNPISTATPKVILTTESGVKAVNVIAELILVEDPMWYESDALKSRKQTLEDQYKRQRQVMSNMDERLSVSVAADVESNITITANLTIDAPIYVNEDLDTTTLEALKIAFNNTDLMDVSYDEYQAFLNNVSAIAKNLADTDKTLQTYAYKLTDAVNDANPQGELNGIKTVNGNLTIQSLSAKDAVIQKTYGEDGERFPLNSTVEGLIKIDDQRTISGTKKFSDLVVKSLLTEAIDDIPLVDVATTKGDYTISNQVGFKELTANNVYLPRVGTVGGIDLTNALSLSGPGKLGNLILTKNLMVSNDISVGTVTVDGINIEKMYNEALTEDGGNIAGVLEFTNEVNANSLHADVLSGISTDYFLRTSVFKDRSTSMHGLTMPSFTSDSLSATKMNSKSFPADFPLKGHKTLNLGNKIFPNVTFGDLHVKEKTTIDGLLLRNLVTLDGEQKITGEKIVKKDVDIGRHLNVRSRKVAGIDFDALYKNVTEILYKTQNRDVIFKGSVSLPTTQYNGKLNRLDIGDLSSDFVYYTDKTAEISGTKSFQANLFVSGANIGLFNGHKANDLVSIKVSLPIKGPKTFQNAITYDQILTTGLVDQVNLTSLFGSAIFKNLKGQTVSGLKVFRSPVFADQLVVKDEVSGVKFSKILTKNNDQEVTAHQTLNSATFANLVTKDLAISENYNVNNIDISELAKRRSSRSNPSAHTGTLTVEGSFQATDLQAENIDGFHLQTLKESIVKDDEDTVVTSDLTFNNLLTTGSVSTRDKVGAMGLNVSVVDENAVKLVADNSLTGQTSWSSMVLYGDVDVGGLLAGQNITEVKDDAVFKEIKSQQISGTKNFTNGFYVKGNVYTDTTNDLDLSTRLLSRHTDQNITAPYSVKTFIATDLYLEGEFNDIDLNYLNEWGLRSHSDTTGDATFQETVTVQDIEFQCLSGGSPCLSEVVRLDAQGVTVTGQKTLKSNVTFKNVEATTVYGQSLNHYYNRAVKKHVPMQLNMTVNKTVRVPNVIADSLDIKGVVDEVDLRSLLQNAVTLKGNQNVPIDLDFDTAISITGKLQTEQLNNIPVKTHYLTTKTTQSIPSDVTFQHISAEAGIYVDGNVNSVDLPTESTKTLKTTGGQTFSQNVQCNGETSVTNNIVTGNTRSLSFADEAVTLDNPGTITANLAFASDVEVTGFTSTSNKLDEIDIVELNTNAWFYNVDAEISAPLSFAAGAEMKGMFLTNHSVDSFLIADVYTSVNNTLRSHISYTEDIKSQYVKKCPLIMEAFENTERAIFEADYFSLSKEFKRSENYIASKSFKVKAKTYLLFSYSGCKFSLFEYDANNELLEESQYPGYVSDWEVLQYGEEIFIIMASENTDLCQDRLLSRVYRFDGASTNKFSTVHQSLGPGNQLEKYTDDKGNDGFALRTDDRILKFSYNSEKHYFNLIANGTRSYEILATLSDGSNNFLELRIVDGKGQLFVNNRFVQQVDRYAKSVNSAVLFTQHDKVFMVLSVTREIRRTTHNLELYLVDPYSGFSWLQTTDLYEPAVLSSFYAGNKATGTTLIVSLQQNWYPDVYMLFGMQLKLFVQLNTPNAKWAHPFAVQHPVFATLEQHYILLGQKDNILLLKLNMNGLTHETDDLECKPDAFKYPQLKDVQKVQ